MIEGLLSICSSYFAVVCIGRIGVTEVAAGEWIERHMALEMLLNECNILDPYFNYINNSIQESVLRLTLLFRMMRDFGHLRGVLCDLLHELLLHFLAVQKSGSLLQGVVSCLHEEEVHNQELHGEPYIIEDVVW